MPIKSATLHHYFNVSTFIVLLGLSTCRSTDDIVYRYNLYDKAQGKHAISLHYDWKGAETFDLQFFQEGYSALPRFVDSLEVSIKIYQDSLVSLPEVRTRLPIDSTGMSSVSFHGIDSSRALFADIQIHGSLVKQRVSFYIHPDNICTQQQVFPQNIIERIDTAIHTHLSQICFADTLPAEPPYLKPVPYAKFDLPLEIRVSDLNCFCIYNTVSYLNTSRHDYVPHLCPSDYPLVRTPRTLFEPIIYLLPNLPIYTNDSIARIYYELFWFKLGDKDFEKARELMRIYYNRVQLANEYFSSYKEGWKTDRGMVTIVLGLPEKILPDTNGETWVYYNSGEGADLIFRFTRILDSPVANDLRMERDNLYEKAWRKAVANWHKNDVFSRFN